MITAALAILAVGVLWLLGKGMNNLSSARSWANLTAEPIPKQVPASVTRWEPTVSFFANKYDLPESIILAQIWQESSGYMNKVGAAGERGLMQIMPGAAQDLRDNGYEIPDDWRENPRSNIRVGSAYLDLQRRRSGNIYSGLKETRATALEAYNEGFAGAQKDVGLDEYAEQVKAKEKALSYV